MKKLNTAGCYTVDAGLKAELDRHFTGLFSDEDSTAAEIRRTFSEDKYLIDTHTAVALNCARQYMDSAKSGHKMVVVSTASPYKFAADVYRSVTGKSASDDFAALAELTELTGVEIPYPLRDIDKREVRFKTVIKKEEMPAEVLSALNIKA